MQSILQLRNALSATFPESQTSLELTSTGPFRSFAGPVPGQSANSPTRKDQLWRLFHGSSEPQSSYESARYSSEPCSLPTFHAEAVFLPSVFPDFSLSFDTLRMSIFDIFSLSKFPLRSRKPDLIGAFSFRKFQFAPLGPVLCVKPASSQYPMQQVSLVVI